MSKTAYQIGAATMLLISQISAAAADSREGAYFSFEGGVNFLQDNDLAISTPGPQLTGELFYNTGWAFGASAGYEWASGIAVEAELAYRQDGLDGEDLMQMNIVNHIGVDGTESSMAFMGNAKFNLDTGTLLTPFVGAGVGLAVLKVGAQPDSSGDFKDTDTQFAYQAMAGVSYAVSPNLHLAFEYIYFATTSPTFAADSVSVDMNYHSQDLLMSLSYDLQ